MRNLIASAAVGAASLLIFFLLLEGGVRLFVPEARWRFVDAAGDWQIDRVTGWVNQPDLDVTSEKPTGPVRFRTNPDGLIPFDATRAKPAGSLRIMVFGDSMVVGRSLPQDEIYTARLEVELARRGIPADVVNAGVLGYSTDQALLLMQRWLPIYRPDVVLYGSTLNDYGGIVLANAYQQAKPTYQLEGGLLRLTLPEVADDVRSFGTGPRRWLQESALYRLLQPAIFLLRARLFGLQERILLGSEQGLYIGDESVEALDWTLYEALVAEMEETAKKAGARFIFFAHPEVGEVWDPYIETVCRQLGVPLGAYDPFTMEVRLSALAQRRGLDFLATVRPFRAAAERGPFHLIPTDAHLNAAGHALLATLLSEKLAGELVAAAPAEAPAESSAQEAAPAPVAPATTRR